ncbi:sarcosine oxidase subunit gamma [Paracoccus tibetensis]|uniref:Sarcosine oxidase subunit gamma n=1 Tax=Paracoccus tibetensis TaxID=336292 RepID=A0A1G5J0D0_9RHOB|nr:sarcosine oxidase subunit gamma family protein [Paracoccus tibetensis]SCY81823.1 sarcosine oxidase subunit gamma [Paracoccus tibetensis]
MAETLATIARIPGLGMLTIRADLARAGEALAEAAGLGLPDTTQITTDGSRSLGWMSPDELLLILPEAELPEAHEALTQALMGEHGLVVDVSDARAVFDVTGPHAADVIAKLAPVDAAHLPEGHLRRTRMAQTAAAIWRIQGGFRVIGFRSTADYLGLILTNAALPGSTLAPR